jgi:hypothetical protein
MIIAFDPGLNGACAILDSSNNLKLFKLPLVDKTIDSKQLIFILKSNCEIDTPIIIEKTWARRGESTTSSFTAGKNYGILLAVANLFSQNVILITPQSWKKQFKELQEYKPFIEAEKKKKRYYAKESSRVLASKLFPNNAKSFARVSQDGNSDAALLALYYSQSSKIFDVGD